MAEQFLDRMMGSGKRVAFLIHGHGTGALRDAYLATLQDHDCDELVRQMDRAGVQRTVLLVPDFTYCLKDAEHTIAGSAAG